MDPLNKMAEHRLSNFKVCDDSILHWPNGHDIARGASQHAFGFFANGQDCGRACLNCDNGWFSQDYPAITHINQGISCAQVDADVVGEQALELR
jgi:hypothetical protein